MAVPVIVSDTEDVNATGGNISITEMASLAVGDLLLAWLFNVNNTAPGTPALISGFTNVATSDNVNIGVGTGGEADDRVCYRIATGSEGPTYTSTATGGVYSLGKLLRITGTHATTPIDGTGLSSTPGATTLALPSVTSTVNDVLAIAFVQTALVDISATPPSGWTLYERWNSNDSAVFYKSMPTPSASGTATASFASSIGAMARVVLVAPTGAAATVPAAVTTLAATPGNTQVALTWTAPADGGATITSYDYRVNGGTWTTTGSASPGYTVTGLTNGVSYNFEVRAVNSVGPAAASNLVSATPSTGAPPSAPAQPTVRVSNEFGLIEWVAPAAGGSAITGYKIERNVNTAGWTTLVANTANLRVWYLDTTLTVGNAVQYRVSAINSGGTSSASTASTSATPVFAALPTAPSVDGRWIADQHGDFWPLFGDAGGLWPFLVDNATIVTYLDNLAAAGMNLWRIQDPQNAAVLGGGTDVVTGTGPFTGTAFASTLDDAYWTRREWMMAQALARGVTVLFQVLWLGNSDAEGWGNEITALTDANLEDTGELFGTRFAGYPNIIWCFAGDRSSPTGTHLARTDAFITGVRASLGATDRFMTIHPGPDTTASDYASGHFYGGSTPFDLDWVINGVYDYSYTIGEYTAAYADNAGPAYGLEGAYQNEHSSTFAELRAQMWFPFVTGGIGHIFGNLPRYHFNVLGAFGGPGTLAQTWEDPSGDLDRGTKDFGVLIDVVAPLVDRLGSDWTPDTTNTFATTGVAEAVFGSTGALIYAPNTTALTLDLTEFGSGTVDVIRYDPITGTSSTIVNDQATTGSLNLAGQGNNSNGATDWVFIVAFTDVVGVFPGGTDLTAAYIGTTPVTAIAVGDETIWP